MRAVVAQRLMWTTLVVPLDPATNDRPRLGKGLKLMLPDTLLFETPKEALDEPILLRCVRGDELLPQPIVPTRRAEAATLKDQAVVTPQGRRGGRAQGAEPRQTRPFCACPFSG